MILRSFALSVTLYEKLISRGSGRKPLFPTDPENGIKKTFNIIKAITVGIWLPETFGYRLFWSLYFKWFRIQMVLCTRPTIWIPDQYIRKQDGIHFSCIQMVGLYGIQMAFKNQTMWHPTSFPPFEYQTSSVFRSPLYLRVHYLLVVSQLFYNICNVL